MTHSFPTRRSSDLIDDPKPSSTSASRISTKAVFSTKLLCARIRRVRRSLPPSPIKTFSFVRTRPTRSEEHTSELQSLMRISYAVFCLKKKKNSIQTLIQEITNTYKPLKLTD